jgi:hypothetical protein
MMKKRTGVVALLALAVLVTASLLLLSSGSGTTVRPGLITDLPTAGAAPEGAYRFVAFGDMGTGESEQFTLARRMTAFHDARPYDAVLMLGDNIYPDGDPAGLPDKFEKPYGDLLRRGVKFHAVLGNHDVIKGRDAEMNYPPFGMGGRAWYSFTKGGGLIEFFALDSTDPSEAQLKWLAGALAQSAARWKVAYFHHPIYSSGSRHGSDLKLRGMLEPLLVRHGVAAVFSGHDHIYERTKPQQGVQYFVSGTGGKLRRGNINRRSPFFAAGNDEANSFMYVEVTRDRFSFWAVSAAGEILDGGVLPAA